MAGVFMIASDVAGVRGHGPAWLDVIGGLGPSHEHIFFFFFFLKST